jgi:hypothetical protein
MTAQVIQFRPVTGGAGTVRATDKIVPDQGIMGGADDLPSDIESDTCSCPSCREPKTPTSDFETTTTKGSSHG